MAQFVPPFFSSFGKASKDLFKKKYDFDNQFKTVNKARNGVTLETGANLSENYKGFIKGKYVSADFGEVESEVYTDPKTESKATLRLKRLAKGLNVTLGASTLEKDKAFKGPVGSADVQYAQEFFAAQAILKTDLDTTKLDTSAAVGFDGVSLGGQVVLNASKGAEIVDINVGAEYTQADFTAAVYTEKNSDVINASYYQRLNTATQVGASFKFELAGKQARSLTVGTEHALDLDTTLKAKIELPSGTTGVAIEHRLLNPRVLVGVAAQFNAHQQPFTAEKFGINLTFGDF